MDKVLLSLFLLSLVVLAYVAFEYITLDKSYNLLQENLQIKDNSLKQCRNELNTTRQALLVLNNQYNKLFYNYTKLQAENENLTTEKTTLEAAVKERETRIKNLSQQINTVLSEITSMEEEINESFAWFKQNSGVSQYVTKLMFKCVGDKKLNIACIPAYLKENGYFTYKSDKEDTLYSIDAMLKNKGGDCEDYALLIKAYINTFSPYINDIIMWKACKGCKLTVYREGHTTYYLADAQKFTVAKPKHVYVVCYTENTTPLSGHCINALSDSLAPNISGATLLEPQTGEYLGKVGTDLGLCEPNMEDCKYMSGNIWLIIDDKQIYTFRNNRWESYSFYYNKLDTVAHELDKLETLGAEGQ